MIFIVNISKFKFNRIRYKYSNVFRWIEKTEKFYQFDITEMTIIIYFH